MNLPAVKAFRKYRRRPFTVVPPWSTDHHDKTVYRRQKPRFLDGIEVLAWILAVLFFSGIGCAIYLLVRGIHV